MISLINIAGIFCIFFRVYFHATAGLTFYYYPIVRTNNTEFLELIGNKVNERLCSIIYGGGSKKKTRIRSVCVQRDDTA